MAVSALRKLAAIVAADVYGYSRLMSVDEERTLAALRGHRENVIDPQLAEHRGRVANTAGDSLLIEFPSIVEALRFSVAMQKGIAARNADVGDDSRVTFRIGINVGDVFEQDGDLLGDGVNVAARLEALAQPGGINISAAAATQVAGKIDLEFDDLGELSLKNISRPVHAYRVRIDGSSPPSAPSRVGSMRGAAMAGGFVLLFVGGGALWWAKPWAENPAPKPETPAAAIQVKADRPVVAVLPFDNMSNDPDQQYFSDGMSEDLITDLSKVSGLLVLARNSTFAYRGKAKDIRQVGQDLNAHYVVEGSVRKAAGRVRINAQLIDARTGNHVWAERYDRDFKDIFTLQDEVIGKIVAALQVSLTPKEQRLLARHETENSEAYDLYLQSRRQLSFFSRQGNEKARHLLQQAIAIDPNFAMAYEQLAQNYSLARENGWADEQTVPAELPLETARKAVALDPELPQAYWSLSRILTRPPYRDPEGALAAIRRAVEIDPSFADGHAFHGQVLVYTGRAEEALGVMEIAMRINPHHPFWYLHIKGQSLLLLRRYEEAIPLFKQAIERNPTVSWPHRWLLAAYGHLGRMDDAEWELAELESLGQLYSIKTMTELVPIVHQPYRDIFLDGLRKAGIPEK